MSQDYGEMRIEQAKFYLPSVRVYYYPGSSSQENIRVFLSEEKLIVSDETLDFKELDGTDYYILTDVSLSIGNDYFTGIQQAVLDFQNGMQEQDTMTLLSFGDTVTVLEDKVSRTADIRRSVEELSNRDQNTHLFEALDCTAKLADCEERALRRTVAIVITDGEDCSTNERTKSEAQERLQEAGIPLYAMAVKETASGAENAFVEEFSDFVRGTQGKLFLFGKEEASECIQGLQTYLQSIQVLNLQTSSNRIHSMMQPLTLTAEGVGSKSLQVCPRYSQKDEEAPIAAAEQTGEKEVKILFSEPVQNAENVFIPGALQWRYIAGLCCKL